MFGLMRLTSITGPPKGGAGRKPQPPNGMGSQVMAKELINCNEPANPSLETQSRGLWLWLGYYIYKTVRNWLGYGRNQKEDP